MTFSYTFSRNKLNTLPISETTEILGKNVLSIDKDHHLTCFFSLNFKVFFLVKTKIYFFVYKRLCVNFVH